MKVFYFTATGNNLYVAKKIGGELYSIPKLIREGKFEFEDEKIGFVFPVYAASVPPIVEEFLRKAKLKSKYFFAVATYGAFSGAVTSHLLEIGKSNGIEFSYIKELLMIDNYLPGFDINKQLEKEPKKKIEENLAIITKDIEAEKKYIKENSFLRRLMRPQLSKLTANSDFDKKFYVEDSCISCKVCEKVCPVNNIKVDQKPIFSNNCQQCLACINNCPQKAIKLKNEKSGARFRNQNVSLNEIIEANS